MGNLGGERHSTSRVHLISVGIHFDIFWEKIIARGVDRERKLDITKKSINHQSCSFQRSNQHKGTKKCTRSQIFAERQIQSFFNYHVFYFILSYIILFFLLIYLFIYSCNFSFFFFYLKLTPEKISSPPPRQGSLPLPPLSRVATYSPGHSRVFSIVSIMAALKILREVTAAFTTEMNNPKRKWPFLAEAEDKDLNERKNWNSLRD